MQVDDLSSSLHSVEKQMKSTAEYFCEDTKKFQIDVLFNELLSFITQFGKALEVSHTQLNSWLL